MKNTIDRTGQRINMLTAIERIPNYNETGQIYYKCKCDCGNIYYESNSHWNKAYSCGCITRRSSSQRIDYTGQKFNHLTVLEMLYKYKNNQTYDRLLPLPPNVDKEHQPHCYFHSNEDRTVLEDMSMYYAIKRYSYYIQKLPGKELLNQNLYI